MIDLMNLQGLLKTGKLEEDRGKAATILTPVFRVSFPKLDEPQDYNGDGKFRYTISMIFNPRESGEPAMVDMNAVIKPVLVRVAEANSVNITAKGGEASPFKSGVLENSQGEPYAGYEPWCVYATAAKYPSKSGVDRGTVLYRGVAVLGGHGKPVSPLEIYGGCFARAMIDLYKPKKFNTIAIGLKYVQFVTDGEAFGSQDVFYDEAPAIEGYEPVEPGFDTDTGIPF
jgi:hypothetical protein